MVHARGSAENEVVVVMGSITTTTSFWAGGGRLAAIARLPVGAEGAPSGQSSSEISPRATAPSQPRLGLGVRSKVSGSQATSPKVGANEPHS